MRTFRRPEDFTDRVERFLDSLPAGHSYAVEIRNKEWLDRRFVDLLRERGVPLALVEQPWMPGIDELAAKLDVVTAGFTYIRLLGDRYDIEKKTKTWDRIVVDRAAETQTWVRYVRQFLSRGAVVYLYVNNHYAGFAPGSIELFHDCWTQP